MLVTGCVQELAQLSGCELQDILYTQTVASEHEDEQTKIPIR